MKWITIKELVDVETGELISLSKYKREDYYTIKNEKISTNYENNGQTCIKRYTTECRKRGQTKLEL